EEYLGSAHLNQNNCMFMKSGRHSKPSEVFTKSLLVLICTLATLAVTDRCKASTLYGSTSAGGPGELYTLNPATGAMLTDVGPLNDSLSVNYPITGLAFNPVSG